MNKLKPIINSYRNDGTDPRKNDAWRILLFSLNYAGGAAITEAIENYIEFYNTRRYQLKLHCMTPMEYHAAYAA